MDKIKLLFNLNNSVFGFSHSILRIIRFPKEIKTRKIRNLNTELIRYKKSDRCYIIGLGPSLKDVNFAKLDGDIIATNRYYRFDSDGVYKPTFYCIVDKAFFIGGAKDDLKKILLQYPDTCFVLNGQYAPAIRKQFPEIRHGYYSFMWNGAMSSKKKLDFTHILPAVNNVVHSGIMLGLYCGYKEIILLGCDFNSFASSKMAHCYADANNARVLPMDYELYCYSLAAHCHNEFQKYADAQGVKILNATKSSLIDSYPFDDRLMEKIYS